MSLLLKDGPDLPDGYGFIALAFGLLLAFSLHQYAMGFVPEEFKLIAFIAGAVPAVMIFLGVPVIVEQIYWRTQNDTKSGGSE